MKNRDAFSSFHPALLFLYYALILIFSMFLTHPLCGAGSFLGAVWYLARLNGFGAVKKALKWAAPVWLLAAGVNVLFNHEGATILTYFSSGNPLTLESALYGLSAGGMIVLVLLWFQSYQAVMSAEKFVYLFGRVAPALSLVLAMILRFVPKFQAQLRAVGQARSMMGGEKRGFAQKVRESVTNFSILVTWSLENAVETADSMRARGYGLPGRTAFSIFRFEKRDRALLGWMLLLAAAVIGAWAGGAFAWRYYPTVRGSFTGWSAAGAAAELLLALTPAAADAAEAMRLRSAAGEAER